MTERGRKFDELLLKFICLCGSLLSSWNDNFLLVNDLRIGDNMQIIYKRNGMRVRQVTTKHVLYFMDKRGLLAIYTRISSAVKSICCSLSSFLYLSSHRLFLSICRTHEKTIAAEWAFNRQESHFICNSYCALQLTSLHTYSWIIFIHNSSRTWPSRREANE